MSYGCEISFKHLPAEDVYDFLVKLKKHAEEHLTDIAKRTVYQSPVFRNYDWSGEMPEFTREQRFATRDWAMLHVFRHRYFYDKKLQILGVYSVHTCLQDIFDCTVYFQNSTDQDYKYETWNGIKYFEEVAEKWKHATPEAVAWEYSQRHHGDICDVSDNERLEYYRRWAAYHEIWDNFEWSLENESDIVYSSLFGSWDFEQMNKFFSALQDAVREEVEEFRAECEKTAAKN